MTSSKLEVVNLCVYLHVWFGCFKTKICTYPDCQERTEYHSLVGHLLGTSYVSGTCQTSSLLSLKSAGRVVPPCSAARRPAGGAVAARRSRVKRGGRAGPGLPGTPPERKERVGPGENDARVQGEMSARRRHTISGV